MRTEPLMIDGIAGPIVLDVNAFTGKHAVTVGGQPATGTRRGDYTLPTADGQTVAAKLRSNLFDPHPTLEIAGVRHRTGPSLPIALRVLMVLPLLLLIGGLIGGAIGGLGVGINLAIARRPQSTAIKALLMVVVLALAVVAFTAVAAALS